MKKEAISWEQTVEWARIVAGCIVYRNGKYLLIQERQSRAYGLWNIPAGHVDKGETIEAAAIREVLEETGYVVRLQRKAGVYHEDIKRSVKHAYFAKITGGKKITSSNEIMQVHWFTYTEIKTLYKSNQINTDWGWLAIQSREASRRKRKV